MYTIFSTFFFNFIVKLKIHNNKSFTTNYKQT